LAEVADVAFGSDIGEIMQPVKEEDGAISYEFNLTWAIENQRTRYIKDIEVRKDGSVRLKIYDKMEALKFLAQLRGMLVERHEITGDKIDWESLSNEQLEKIAKTGKL
jgi:hypothetical protein